MKGNADACPDPEDLLAFFHGEGKAETGDHVSGCESCRLRLREFGALGEILGRPPAAEVPAASCPDEQALRQFLSGGGPSLLEAHLSDCPCCIERLAAIADVAASPAGPFPEGLRARLEGLALRRRARPATRRRSRLFRRFPDGRPAPIWIAVAVAALVLLSLAGLFGRRSPAPPSPRDTARVEPGPGQASTDPGPRPDVPAEPPSCGDERERLERALEELAETRRRYLEEARAYDLQRLERERLEAEERLGRLRREEIRAAEERARREPRPVTAAAVAAVERAEGEIFLIEGAGRRPAVAGVPVLEGQGLTSIGAASELALAYPDGTRLELSGDAVMTLRSSKGVFLIRGLLRAEVVRSPGASFFEVETPHATARVIGTELRLRVDSTSTRLEVTRGRVRFTRSSDGRSLEVSAGFSATAAPGMDLLARPIHDPALPAVLGLTLIDADTGLPVPGYDPIPQGATLTLSKLPRRLNMRADTRPERVGSVLFALDDNPRFQVQNGLPYSAFGGAAGRWWAWENPKPGPHVLTATPFTGAKASGLAGRPFTLRFIVRK